MTEEQAVEGIEWATRVITALRAKVASLEAEAARIPAAPDDVERLRAALSIAETEARRFAGFYPEASDGRNTFVIFADEIAALNHTTKDDE